MSLDHQPELAASQCSTGNLATERIRKERFVSREAAAERLAISKKSVGILIRDGHIREVRVLSGLSRIPESSLNEFVAKLLEEKVFPRKTRLTPDDPAFYGPDGDDDDESGSPDGDHPFAGWSDAEVDEAERAMIEFHQAQEQQT